MHITPSDSLVPSAATNYTGMLEVLLASLSSGSRRQYEHTYTDWRRWCEEQHGDPLDLSAPHILDYLNNRPLARVTKQARLTHLRRLVHALYSADTTNTVFETYHAQLQLLRLSIDDQPAEQHPKSKKRPGKRLDGSRVHELIAAYPVSVDGKPCLRGLRNRALLAVLFYAGLRRFEVVKLQWADVDFEQEHIKVVGGKGRQRDSVEYVPFLGSLARHLKVWQAQVPGRTYVFPRLLKGGHLGADEPISDEGLYYVFRKDFAPHDARRTLISDLLESGTYIGDVRAIARHASESTTLRYAKANATKIIQSRAKLGY